MLADDYTCKKEYLSSNLPGGTRQKTKFKKEEIINLVLRMLCAAISCAQGQKPKQANITRGKTRNAKRQQSHPAGLRPSILSSSSLP